MAAARDAYDYATDDPGLARYRQGVCDEHLGHVERALASYANALERVAAVDPRPPWADDAERSLRRLSVGCPARSEQASR
jgi:hypothetical protein